MREPNAVDQFIRINPQSNMLEPNWMWRDILPFSLGPDAAQFQSGAVALNSASPVVVPYKLSHSSLGYDDAVGSPLEINQIVQTNDSAQSNPQFTVFVSDMGDQRQYMNAPIHVDTFAGSGQLSARLTEPLFVPTRHQLAVQFQRIGNSNIQAQLYFLGKLYDTWSSNLQKYDLDHKEIIATVNRALERRKYVTPYWLTTDGGAVAVPANQTVEIDTPVGDEGHFECSHILRKFTGGDPAAAAFELELINPQTRQTLMNGRIHSYMIGNGLNPQPFPAPFIIPAGQLLRFRITDLSGAPNMVYITLRGMKIRAPFKTRMEVEREMGIAPKPAKVAHAPQHGNSHNPHAQTHHAEMAGA